MTVIIIFKSSTVRIHVPMLLNKPPNDNSNFFKNKNLKCTVPNYYAQQSSKTFNCCKELKIVIC